MTILVGQSGSGKSTVSILLMRFYRTQSGLTTIDNDHLEDIDTHWLGKNITLVQQNFILFSDTIFHNMALGHRDYQQVMDHQLRSCIKSVGLESLLRALPEGVQTRIGNDGSSISGGQKQRVALARARLRDTPILILDEATCALDKSIRLAVMQSIRTWRRGRTTIVITHDLARLEADDLVYVLRDGSVIQQGYCKDLDNLKVLIHADNARTNIDRSDLPKLPGVQALSANPHRKDSFDVETFEIALNSERMFTSHIKRTSNPVLHQVNANTIAAINVLRRQSVARARAMYTSYYSQSLNLRCRTMYCYHEPWSKSH
jgi:ATP-binding cassette, subfamily B (MDR/TAP), member 1